MVIEAARQAANDIFSPPFRRVFFKTLGLTLLMLVACWFGLQALFDWLAWPWLEAMFPGMPSWMGWLGLAVAIVAGLGLALVLALLIAPVTAIISGLFLDDAAALVETSGYPADRPGQAMPAIPSLVHSLKFLLVVLVGNLIALVLLLVPGVNVGAFFIINGYLIGREFFEFAAMRFLPEAEAKERRRRNAGTVFLAGLVIAAVMTIPLLNLLSPLFACAMMVHLHKAVAREEATKMLPQSNVQRL